MYNPKQAVTSKPPIYLIAAVFLVIVLFAPQSSPDSLTFGSFLSLAVSGAASAWIFSSVGWVIGFLTVIPVATLSFFLVDGFAPYLLCSLLYLTIGIPFSLVSKKKLTRSVAIGISATAITTITLAMLLFQAYISQGSLSLGAIEACYSDFFTLLKDMLKKSFTISIAGQDVSFITDANIHQYVNIILGIIPGLFGFFAVLVGFLGGWFYKLLLNLTHSDLPDTAFWKLQPAPITGIFFTLSIIVSLFGDASPHLWLASLSVSFILLPEFCMAGVASVFEVRVVDGLPRPRLLRAILLFLGMLNGLFGFLMVSAGLGIIDSIRSAFPTKKNDSNRL